MSKITIVKKNRNSCYLIFKSLYGMLRASKYLIKKITGEISIIKINDYRKNLDLHKFRRSLEIGLSCLISSYQMCMFTF